MSKRAFTSAINSAVKAGNQSDTLGSRREEEDKEYIYVKGVVSAEAGDAVAILEDYSVVRLTETEAVKGRRVGILQADIVADYYGWAQIRGVATVKGAASCAKDKPLYATAAAGVIDDAGTTGIFGIISTETITTAGPMAVLLSYPNTMCFIPNA